MAYNMASTYDCAFQILEWLENAFYVLGKEYIDRQNVKLEAYPRYQDMIDIRHQNELWDRASVWNFEVGA